MSCDEGTFLKTAAREAFLPNLCICALDARRVTSQDGGERRPAFGGDDSKYRWPVQHSVFVLFVLVLYSSCRTLVCQFATLNSVI
jgi:hypothetical protein